MLGSSAKAIKLSNLANRSIRNAISNLSTSNTPSSDNVGYFTPATQPDAGPAFFTATPSLALHLARGLDPSFFNSDGIGSESDRERPRSSAGSSSSRSKYGRVAAVQVNTLGSPNATAAARIDEDEESSKLPIRRRRRVSSFSRKIEVSDRLSQTALDSPPLSAHTTVRTYVERYRHAGASSTINSKAAHTRPLPSRRTSSNSFLNLLNDDGPVASSSSIRLLSTVAAPSNIEQVDTILSKPLPPKASQTPPHTAQPAYRRRRAASDPSLPSIDSTDRSDQQFTQAIESASYAGDFDALQQAIQAYRLSPHSFTVAGHNAVMSALLREGKGLEQGLGPLLEVFNEMLENSLQPNITTSSILIKALCDRDEAVQQQIRSNQSELGRYEHVKESAEKRYFRADATSELIKRYRDELELLGHEKSAASAFQIFKTLGQKGGRISDSAFIALLKSASSHGRTDLAAEAFAKRDQEYPNAPRFLKAYLYLLEAQAKNDQYESAKLVFQTYRDLITDGAFATEKELLSRDVIPTETAIWNTMMKAHFKAGQPQEAVKLLEELLNANQLSILHLSSFFTVLEGFASSGDAESTLHWFQRLAGESGLLANLENQSNLMITFCANLMQNISNTSGRSQDVLSECIVSIYRFTLGRLPADAAMPVNLLHVLRSTLESLSNDKPEPQTLDEEFLVQLDRLALQTLEKAKAFDPPEQSITALKQLLLAFCRVGHPGVALDLAQAFFATCSTYLDPTQMPASHEIQDLAQELQEATSAVPQSEALATALNLYKIARSSALPIPVKILEDVQRHASSIESRLDQSEVHVQLPTLLLALCDDHLLARSAGTDAPFSLLRALKANNLNLTEVCQDPSLFFELARAAHSLSQQVEPAVIKQLFEGILATEQVNAIFNYDDRVESETHSETTLHSSGTNPSVFSANVSYPKTDITTSSGVSDLDLSLLDGTQQQRSLSPLPTYLTSTQVRRVSLARPLSAISDILERMAQSHMFSRDAKSSASARDFVLDGLRARSHLPSIIASIMLHICQHDQADPADIYDLYLLGYEALEHYKTRPEVQLALWDELEDAALISMAHLGLLDRVAIHRDRIIQAGRAPSADAYAAMILNARDTTDDATVAIELFEESRRLGVIPNTYLFNNLISRLSKARRTKAALDCFRQMKQAGIEATAVTYGAVINACCKVGDITAATTLFDEMVALPSFLPRVPPFNTMIQFFVSTEPDREKALHYYMLMKKFNVKPTAHTYKLLLDCYGHIQPYDMVSVQAVFSELERQPKVDVEGVHWASIITAQGGYQKNIEEAIRIFDSIQLHPTSQRMLLPDAVCYEAILNACVSNGRYELMDHYLAQMKERNIHSTAYVENSRIRALAAQDKLDEARKVFESLADPISGVAAQGNHAKGRKNHKGRELPRNMETSEPVYREPSTYETMIKVELEKGDPAKARDIFLRAQGRAFPLPVIQRLQECFLSTSPTQPDEPSNQSV